MLTVAVVSISVRYDVTVASAFGAVTVRTTSGVVSVPLCEPEIASGPGVDNVAVFVPCDNTPVFVCGPVPSFGFHVAVAPSGDVSMSVMVTLPLLLSNSYFWARFPYLLTFKPLAAAGRSAELPGMVI
jgi:hypothetical protein